ncbi:MAG TPA: serine/threonine-protein kinase [Acidimicrobiia bacterium]|nr:serine/threonine-protein kinase [Acidimicrobiia bacterium]
MEQAAVNPPRTLAERYELGAVLGHGGMGTVRDATDARLARPVAVKILRADLAQQATARRRFETEAHAAARLTHPNVVMVFDSGEDHGVPFLVMERLPGRTLADELASGPMDTERALDVAREILAALEAAHDAGIIHRDIKPGNVLLTDDGHVKVSDFGIAKTVDDLDQTQTTDLVATPGYLAPERLAGEPASCRSDLYSVGVLLYEALSGRRPFAGQTHLALMRAIERGDAVPLASIRPEVSAGLVAVVERAMEVDPTARFDSAAEMSAALGPRTDAIDREIDLATHLDASPAITPADLSETVRIDPQPARDGTQVLRLPPPADSPPAGSPRRRRRAPRPRRALTVGIGAALAAVLVFGVAASQRNSGRPGLPQTTVPAGSVAPVSTKVPAPLNDAITQLEQVIAK